MQKNNRRIYLKIIGIFIFCFLPLFPQIGQGHTPNNFTVPITHISTPVEQISIEELWAIFTLNITQWENGQKIIVVMYNNESQIQRTFLREYFGINPFRFQEIISRRINTGKTNPPIIVETEQQMIYEVAKKPGRIGFVRNFVVLGDSNGVKYIKIN